MALITRHGPILQRVRKQPNKRQYSVSSQTFAEPRYVRLPSGVTIPNPPGRMYPLDPKKVMFYGEAVLDQWMQVDSPLDEQFNDAMAWYKRMRPLLLSGQGCGKWMAINCSGTMVVGDSEAFVRKLANEVFPAGKQEYYADCLGCEVLQGVVMDDTAFNCFSNLGTIPFGSLSSVSEEQFLIRAEHSFDGLAFTSHVMKHDSGANMVGVPKEVLSNPPRGVQIVRAESLMYTGPHGHHRARTYEGHFVRVQGLITKLRVIEARVWLLGFPVLSRFANVLNVKSKDPVLMTPLPGEIDHF